MARPSKLQQARERNELARLELDTTLRVHKQKIVSEYEATKSSVKRRQPVNEYKNEDGILPMFLRQKAVNIGRDLERNYSPAKGILHQFKVNVVGSLGKLQVNLPNEGGKEATGWFNGVWAKDCDYRDDIHFSNVLQNVVSSVMREGDILSVVDDDLIDDSGKLIHWEADQIMPVAENLIPERFKGATQENGILRGKFGKVLAYVCTGKRGSSVIDDIKDATFWPRDQARLVKNPWRLNQGRGIPSILTSATNFTDLYEILSKELQSAKVAAGQYASVKRSNAVTNWDAPASNPEYLPENTGKTATEVAAEGANSTTNPAAVNYNRLESYTGGYIDYLDAGDEVDIADITRPNVHLMEFCEAVLGHAGASVGLARAYTILRADSSYTAFRGDMILSWVTFYAMQKWLERTYADWVARKVLTWAQRKERIKPLPAGWEQSLSWTWPTMPHVDEAREEAAIQNALKNATMDYSELLGPDWQNKLTAYSKQLDVARDLNLPLSVFETVSGGALTPLETPAVDPAKPEPKKQKGNK
jgi:capsid protein